MTQPTATGAPVQNLAHLEEQIKAMKAELGRRDQIDRIRKLVVAHIPMGAKILMVSAGDRDLLHQEGRHGMHFPQTEQGAYEGMQPATSDDVIAHLEALRTGGAEYLLLPATSN